VQPVQNHEIHFFIGVTRSRSATLVWWLRTPGTPINAPPPQIRGQYPVAFEHVSF
jgi:hypothetical protein